MKNLLLLFFLAILFLGISSCGKTKYSCSCYCVGTGTGEYSATLDLTGKKRTEENAATKCQANAEASGQNCTEWMCHATELE